MPFPSIVPPVTLMTDPGWLQGARESTHASCHVRAVADALGTRHQVGHYLYTSYPPPWLSVRRTQFSDELVRRSNAGVELKLRSF